MKQGGFDVALIDLKMPDISGIDLIKAARAHTSAKLLAFSAGLTDERIAQCKAAGFDGVLDKPVFRETLVQELSNLVEASISGQVERTAGTENHAVFDETAFLNLFDGDKEMTMEMLQSFEQSLKKELPDLLQAMEERDVERIGDVLHKLSPSYRQAGADAMLHFFAKIKPIEWLDQDDASVKALQLELEDHMVSLRRALEQFHKRLRTTLT
jgi:CheY-like chemotaxis protein